MTIHLSIEEVKEACANYINHNPKTVIKFVKAEDIIIEYDYDIEGEMFFDGVSVDIGETK